MPSTKPSHDLSGTLFHPSVIKQLSTPGKVFDRAGLLAEIFKALGERGGKDGQAALAEIMVGEFFAAKAGSISRQRLLDSICRLVNWHSDDVHQLPVEEMTEDELISSISAALPKLRLIAEEPLGGGAAKPFRWSEDFEGEPET
jgi:hypothetical protein